MPQIITYGAELIRINTSKNKIEYSTNKGATWNSRYSGSSVGTFIDLIEYGNEIIAGAWLQLFEKIKDGD